MKASLVILLFHTSFQNSRLMLRTKSHAYSYMSLNK